MRRPPSRGPPMTTQSGSLLIVDDDELGREGLTRRLQRQGYEVACARTGREALEMLGGRRFDLLLLDVMMRGRHGRAVLGSARRLVSRIRLPVIMVPARGETARVAEALELGPNASPPRPPGLPVARARIRPRLALRRAEEAPRQAARRKDEFL